PTGPRGHEVAAPAERAVFVPPRADKELPAADHERGEASARCGVDRCGGGTGVQREHVRPRVCDTVRQILPLSIPRAEAQMRQPFFTEVRDHVAFGGSETDDPLAFSVYDPDRLVLGRRMEEHLRIGVCLWHSFAWPGFDMFGVGTFDRPWNAPGLDPLVAAEMKLDAAFEFLTKLGVPYFCVHDRDIAPEGANGRETRRIFD